MTGLSESFSEVSERQMSVSLGMALAVYGLAVPILEETIFRWFVFGKLLNVIKTFRSLPGNIGVDLRIFLSSILFGLYHGNIVQGVYAFLMGALFCYIYSRTGRLLYAIFMHGVANVTVFCIFSSIELVTAINTPIHCLIFFVVAIGCLRRLVSRF